MVSTGFFPCSEGERMGKGECKGERKEGESGAEDYILRPRPVSPRTRLPKDASAPASHDEHGEKKTHSVQRHQSTPPPATSVRSGSIPQASSVPALPLPPPPARAKKGESRWRHQRSSSDMNSSSSCSWWVRDQR